LRVTPETVEEAETDLVLGPEIVTAYRQAAPPIARSAAPEKALFERMASSAASAHPFASAFALTERVDALPERIDQTVPSDNAKADPRLTAPRTITM